MSQIFIVNLRIQRYLLLTKKKKKNTRIFVRVIHIKNPRGDL